MVKSFKAPQLWVKKNRQFAAALAAAQLAAEPWGCSGNRGETNWVPPLAKIPDLVLGMQGNIIEHHRTKCGIFRPGRDIAAGEG